MEEVWKDIPGYEGEYQVSDQGRVRSVDRMITAHWRGKPYRRRSKGQIVKGTGRPYLGVMLGRYSVKINVHQLVLLAFVGPCPEGLEICHNNGDPTDNRLVNLRYDTRSENVRDTVRCGSKGILPERVRHIRGLIAQGLSSSQIAKQEGLPSYTINGIRANRIYKWVT